MLFYLISRIVSATAAFLYPGYASYKTLSQRPASEEDLERWLMYWSVLGFVVAAEYFAEWLISWIPFYFTLKTLFLLYLALPQTKGSTYLYVTHLQPFFLTHETQIDAILASAKRRGYTFLQDRMRSVFEQFGLSMGQQPAQQQAAPAPVGPAASAPAALLGSLWTAYGPGIIASGAAILTKGAAVNAVNSAASKGSVAASMAAAAPLSTPPKAAAPRHDAIEARKRQLEAELAALNAAAGTVPMPPASPQLLPSRGSSSSDVRMRTSSGRLDESVSGRFEEVEVPSDAEDEGIAVGGPKKAAGGWFGGWAGGSKDGYERVKSD